MSPAELVPCLRCGAEPGRRCRAVSGRAGPAHAARRRSAELLAGMAVVAVATTVAGRSPAAARAIFLGQLSLALGGEA